jgi:hypothetical protein
MEQGAKRTRNGLPAAAREKREREWLDEQARVQRSGAMFEALPTCAAVEALKVVMTDRIVWLYDRGRMEEGDAILEFLPNNWAMQLLDWYFDEDGKVPHPAQAAAGEDENNKSRQIQDGTQNPIGPDGKRPEQAHAIGEPI